MAVASGRPSSAVWVSVAPDNSLTCAGLAVELADLGITSRYNAFEEAPAWMQERLRKLMMLNPGVYVAGVGERMSDSTFWVHAGE